MLLETTGFVPVPKGRRRKNQRKTKFFKSQNGKCCFCDCDMILLFGKQKIKSKNLATWEHKIPVSMGGKDGNSNLALSCSECNNIRGTYDFQEFKKLRRSGISKIEISKLTIGRVPKNKQELIDKNRRTMRWAIYEYSMKVLENKPLFHIKRLKAADNCGLYGLEEIYKIYHETLDKRSNPDWISGKRWDDDNG